MHIGFPKYAEFKELSDICEYLLPNNTLTIVSKVTVFGRFRSIMDSNVNLAATRAKEAFEQKLELLRTDNRFHEVIFNVGSRRFGAPLSLLIARSDVFSAMFDNEWEEATKRIVNIEDVHPEIFEELLRYLITGRVSSNEVLNAELFVAANKVFTCLYSYFKVVLTKVLFLFVHFTLYYSTKLNLCKNCVKRR